MDDIIEVKIDDSELQKLLTDLVDKTQNRDLKKVKFCQENEIKPFVINIMGLKNKKKTLEYVYQSQLKSHFM